MTACRVSIPIAGRCLPTCRASTRGARRLASRALQQKCGAFLLCVSRIRLCCRPAIHRRCLVGPATRPELWQSQAQGWETPNATRLNAFLPEGTTRGAGKMAECTPRPIEARTHRRSGFTLPPLPPLLAPNPKASACRPPPTVSDRSDRLHRSTPDTLIGPAPQQGASMFLARRSLFRSTACLSSGQCMPRG